MAELKKEYASDDKGYGLDDYGIEHQTSMKASNQGGNRMPMPRGTTLDKVSVKITDTSESDAKLVSHQVQATKKIN